MVMFKEGDNPQPGTPAVDVRDCTFGYRLANGKVTPCTAQGQKAEFVFGDTVRAVTNGHGVPLFSKTHSGGIGVPVLAGGPIAMGADICVGMVEFTIDGVAETLPVAIDAADADDGDWIVGKATFGSYATAKDTNIGRPSIALEFYDNPMPKVGGETADQYLDFEVQLANVADGDVVTDFAPGFAGEIISTSFTVTDPVTTAAKAATFNFEINAVGVTGGTLAITSANATPLGKVIAGTAVTALNTFDADDTISIVASAVTAFVEGAGTIRIRVRVAAQ